MDWLFHETRNQERAARHRAFWREFRLQFLQRVAFALGIVALLKMAGWL